MQGVECLPETDAPEDEGIRVGRVGVVAVDALPPPAVGDELVDVCERSPGSNLSLDPLRIAGVMVFWSESGCPVGHAYTVMRGDAAACGEVTHRVGVFWDCCKIRPGQLPMYLKTAH